MKKLTTRYRKSEKIRLTKGKEKENEKRVEYMRRKRKKRLSIHTHIFYSLCEKNFSLPLFLPYCQ